MNLYISEYFNEDCIEPAIKTQTVPIDEAGAVSEPFSEGTRYVKLRADEFCAIRFGDEPLAVLDADPKLVANVAEVFRVYPGYRIAVVGEPPGRDLARTAHDLEAISRILYDPKKAAAMLARLVEVTDRGQKIWEQVVAKQNDLKQTQAALDQRSGDLDRRAQNLVKLGESVDNRQQTVSEREKNLATAQENHMAIVERHKQNVADSMEALDKRSAALDQRENELAFRLKKFDEQDKALSERESTIADREARLRKASQDVAQRMAKLKELVN